jgi:hypothetical protein
VKTGQFSDPVAEGWIADCLIARRDKIGRAFFTQVLPLDRFRIQEGRLTYEDLAVKHGLSPTCDYKVQWLRFNNETGESTPLPGETAFALPRLVQEASGSEYFAASIHGAETRKTVTVYLRKQAGSVRVVGIDRTW